MAPRSTKTKSARKCGRVLPRRAPRRGAPGSNQGVYGVDWSPMRRECSPRSAGAVTHLVGTWRARLGARLGSTRPHFRALFVLVLRGAMQITHACLRSNSRMKATNASTRPAAWRCTGSPHAAVDTVAFQVFQAGLRRTFEE